MAILPLLQQNQEAISVFFSVLLSARVYLIFAILLISILMISKWQIPKANPNIGHFAIQPFVNYYY